MGKFIALFSFFVRLFFFNFIALHNARFVLRRFYYFFFRH